MDAWKSKAKEDPQEEQNRQAAMNLLTPQEQEYVTKHTGNMPGVATFFR